MIESESDIQQPPRPIAVMAKRFQDGHQVPIHSHDRSQLLYASSGVMRVSTSNGIWVVPPQRAVWIPAQTSHQIAISGELFMKTLYIDASFFSGPSKACCVIAVSPLLRELIRHAMAIPPCYPLEGKEGRLLAVILDQIQSMDIDPLALPIPEDKRLLKLYQHISRNPGDDRTLDAWGKVVGATGRTLARRFRMETGLSFGQWRQQIRILEALKLLAMGDTVTTVATELGYASTSAFISMFKRALGKTPRHYFAN